MDHLSTGNTLDWTRDSLSRPPDQYDPNSLSEISLILGSRRTIWLVYAARLMGGCDFYLTAGTRPGTVQLLLSWFIVVLRLYPYL
ncbi:hypothetical protein Taro_049199, partial [Colocasia esculenta]|nr:hypothetical protein [Colocasia esculenta]